MSDLKILIASDHAGFHLKESIAEHLIGIGAAIVDLGTNSDSSVDYPDYAHPLGDYFDQDSTGFSFGILICGSGNGVAMTANKHTNVRAALCWNTEIARLAKQHNDANVIALPSRFISPKDGIDIVKAYMDTEFEGGRHQRRVDKIPC